LTFNTEEFQFDVMATVHGFSLGAIVKDPVFKFQMQGKQTTQE